MNESNVRAYDWRHATATESDRPALWTNEEITEAGYDCAACLGGIPQQEVTHGPLSVYAHAEECGVFYATLELGEHMRAGYYVGTPHGLATLVLHFEPLTRAQDRDARLILENIAARCSRS